jgi:hypothetical protein
MQQATTSVVGVTNFDSNTGSRMLTYLYTGDYENG